MRLVDLLQDEYKYKTNAMHKSTQLKRQAKEPQFVKGMKLNEYLASYPQYPAFEGEEKDQKQENLFQSSHYAGRKGLHTKNTQQRIEEIDQESIQDSIQYNKPTGTRATPTFKEPDFHKNETSEENLLPQKNIRGKIHSLSINIQQNIKGSSQQKNNFRVKRMSMSPAKRKTEDVVPNGSITLYGSKFGQVSKKEETKMPELLTFYGKLSLEKQQGKPNPKASLTGDIKPSFKKKNQLELKDLLMAQNRIKSNYSLGSKDRDMMVLGVKDKLNQRKQRHV